MSKTWSNDKTRQIAEMLEKDEDHKSEILDRFADRDILSGEVFQSTISEMAFIIEDEVRADMRFHFIDVSMWADIVEKVISGANYKEIAEDWLYAVKTARQKTKEEKR